MYQQDIYQPPTPSPISPAPTGPAPKSKTRTPFLIGGGILVGVCLCGLVCAPVFGGSVFKAATQRDDLRKILHSFMQAMAAQDIDQAYSLFSSRAQAQVPRSKVQDLAQGANHVLFDGYEQLEVLQLSVGPAFNTNPDVPQGTVAKVSGVISYSGGYKGQFQAVLEQENKMWKLDSINVTVPPEKIQHNPQGSS